MAEEFERCHARHEGTGKLCKKVAGHDGDHHDKGFTITWDDSECVPDAVPWPNNVLFAYVNGTWMSRREVQVIQTAADGLNSKEAADLLGLHLNTVKTHKFRIARKVGAKNTAHAVALCFRAGVLK